MNSDDRDTPTDIIIIQGIKIFDTETHTKSQSLLKFGLKLQGLYYTSLQIANVKKYHKEHGRGPLSLYWAEYTVY